MTNTTLSIDNTELLEILIRNGYTTQEEINECGNELKKRRVECEIEGHKEPEYTYAISNRSSHRDRVNGICKYCLTSLERGLTSEEHKEIDQFRKFCREVPIY